MGIQGIWGLIMVFLGIGLLAAQTGEAADASAIPMTIGQRNNAFAVDLYSQIKTDPGNLFFCPFSIRIALMMTYAGARGTTAQEMAGVLHVEEGQPSVHQVIGQWVRDLNQQSEQQQGYELRIANALWGQKDYGFLKEFLDLTQASYEAGLQKVDFANAVEQTRNTINAWVEEQTHGHIVDFIKPDMLDTSATLVLTNAVYFKGAWLSPFKKEKTIEAPFNLINGETIDAPMMIQNTQVGYAEDDVVQIVELLYEGEQLSMILILPKDPKGIGELESALSMKFLDQQIASLQQQKVAIIIPKFTMEADISLPEALKNLGMKDAFTLPPADFSGMTGTQDLYISEAFHKAFLEINEEGSEATAATEVTMSRGLSRTPTFQADHPFILMIREKQTNGLLFLGRLMDPRG